MAVPPTPLPPSDPGKPAVRAALRKARRAHVAALREEGRYDAMLVAAAERVAAHVPPGVSVALYQPFGDEIDPTPLARRLAERGHPLALPHVAADRTTMRFLAWHPDHALVTGVFGLSQPAEGAEPVSPALVLTPLVGFDRAGGRIGQGAGFYDRAFAGLPGATRIGFAWSVQELAHVPHDPWDVPLHAVATEREWIALADPAA